MSRYDADANYAVETIDRIYRSGTDGDYRALPPMLILQGDRDDNIPLTIPERFVETYLEKGGAVDITYFPGMSHAFAQQPGPDTDRAIGLMKDFLTRNV